MYNNVNIKRKMEISNMAVTYAKRMRNLKASEIREILKVTESPEMLSFAGGLPDPAPRRQQR